LWWRAPQQKLRTHRSLEACCAALWWRWLAFPFFRVMDHGWNEIDRGKSTYSGATLSHCHFVHHTSHIDRLGIKPEPARWEALIIFSAALSDSYCLALPTSTLPCLAAGAVGGRLSLGGLR
jgi:hypothetical protein